MWSQVNWKKEGFAEPRAGRKLNPVQSQPGLRQAIDRAFYFHVTQVDRQTCQGTRPKDKMNWVLIF